MLQAYMTVIAGGAEQACEGNVLVIHSIEPPPQNNRMERAIIVDIQDGMESCEIEGLVGHVS